MKHEAKYQQYDWITDTKYPEKLFHIVREWSTVLAIDEYSRILDAGCGTGLITRHLNNAIGLDVNNWALNRAKFHAPKATFIQGSITALPFADDSFDLVICTHTLEHIIDPKVALCEFLRVGRMIIGAVPTNFILWHYRKYLTRADIHEEPFHVNYSRQKLETLLESYRHHICLSSFGLEWQFKVTK